jgi:hypothetical protein
LRNRNFPWALFGAGAVAGAIVVLAVILSGLWPAPDNSAGALDARVAQLEGRVRELATRPPTSGVNAQALDDLASRVAKLEAAKPVAVAGTPDEAIANRIAGLEGELKAIEESVGMLGRRSDEASTAAREAGARADAAAAAVADLARKLPPPQPAVQKSDLDALAARVAAVEGAQKALQAELAKRPQATDQPGRFAVAATALNAAVESSAPFTGELAAVKALTADPGVATLEPFAASGLPTPAALARELATVAPAVLQAGGAGPNEGSFLEKLQANAEKLVRIRPTDEGAGTDTAAVVARAQAKAARGDIAGAAAELQALPSDVRAPAVAWIEKAQRRAAAVEVSQRLAAAALSGLGK